MRLLFLGAAGEVTGSCFLLEAAGSHLVLTGVSERVLAQLTGTRALDHVGTGNVFTATPNLGESLLAGLRRAEQLRGVRG